MPRKLRVDITESAESDILSIRDFIARDKKTAATRWVGKLKRQIRSLASMPLRYEVMPEAAEQDVNYRHVIVGNYRLIYEVKEDRVIILRVVHGAQRLGASFFRSIPPS